MEFKELETQRLLLKNISYEDTAFILHQFSDDDINRYLFDQDPMTEEKEATDLIEFYTTPEPRTCHRWILVRKSDGAKLGTCGFHCWNRANHTIEAGYDMQKAYWKQGYMTEAMEAILAFAAENLGIKRIDAQIYIENQNSIALAKRLGFEFHNQTVVYTYHGKDYLHQIYSKEC